MNMILTLRNKIKNNKIVLLQLGVLFLIAVFFSNPTKSFADKGLELSVTPTLFEMSAEPGQQWRSNVKVINSNKYSLTVYAEVVNFAPKGEAGEGKFLPVFENFTEGKTLAEWVDLSSEAVVIPPESSKNIPFSVKVPDDASPGGHFAAIMVGTRPPKDKPQMNVSTSQIVTSLFFVRVSGDVVEDGVIREFTTKEKIVDTPQAAFSLRFENKGNVHIQPQGRIEITNMWGKQRGIVPINHQTHFGNVLPKSIRKFEFTWSGEPSLMDIGRYKASVTLGYGLDGKKFQSSTAYFYVLPLKSMSIFLVSIIFIFWFVSWSIKIYVRRMLTLSGLDIETTKNPSRSLVREGDVLIQKRKTSVKAPLLSGVTDLRTKFKGASKLSEVLKAAVSFLASYKMFFVSLIILVLIVIAIFYFVVDVSKSARDYNVTIENADQAVELSSEDIIYGAEESDNERVESHGSFKESTSTDENSQLFRLELINAADTPGLAAAMKRQLEDADFEVAKIGSDFNNTQDKTVVVYTLGYEESALKISRAIGKALPSARPKKEESGTPKITVYIGNDYTGTSNE